MVRLESSKRKVSLAEVCDIVIGRTPSRKDAAAFVGSNLWAKIGDMESGKILSQTKEMISDAAVVRYRCPPILPGTVLLSFKLSIGKVAVAGARLFTNEAIAALPIKESKRQLLLSNYLSWALQAATFGEGVNIATKGKTLTTKKLGEMKIPLPPLAEQKRIVKSLNAKMASIAKAKAAADKQLEAINALPAACLHRAFPSAEK